MARGPFTTSNYLACASASVTAAPLSVSCWVYYPAGTTIASDCIIDLHNSGSTTSRDQFSLLIDAGGALNARTSSSSASSSSSDSTNVVLAGAWYHCAGLWASSSSRRAALNGVFGSTSTATRVPSGINQETIGLERGSASQQPCEGYIADVAIWSDALTANECRALYNGQRPDEIRPANLVRWWPLEEGFYREPCIAADTSAAMVQVGAVSWMDGPYAIASRINPRNWYRNMVAVAGGAVPLKAINDLLLASVKTINGLAIASVKTVNGLSTT